MINLLYNTFFFFHCIVRPIGIVGMATGVWQKWFEIGVALNIPISKLEGIHTSDQAQDDQKRFQVSYYITKFNSFDDGRKYMYYTLKFAL